MSDNIHNYLRDTLHELLQRAREAKVNVADVGRHQSPEAIAFEKGRAMAYYEVVDHLINQLDAFGIDRSAVNIDRGLDVDRELL